MSDFSTPIGLTNDPGHSDVISPSDHQHQMFDIGELCVMNTTHWNGSIKAYAAADWLLCEGIVNLVGATLTSNIIGWLPTDRDPLYTNLFRRWGKLNADPLIPIPVGITVRGSGEIQATGIIGTTPYNSIYFTGVILRRN